MEGNVGMGMRIMYRHEEDTRCTRSEKRREQSMGYHCQTRMPSVKKKKKKEMSRRYEPQSWVINKVKF